MTEKRAMDSAEKILFHEEWLRKWKKDPFSAPPIYGEIGPASWCNHDCIFCAFDYLRGKKILLETKVLLRAVKEMGEMGVRAIQYAGEGEPLLHPKLADIILATREAGIEVAMLTNGELLKQNFIDKALKGLTWFQASIDAGTNETHCKIHRPNSDMQSFARVLRNLAYAVRMRNKNNFPCEIGAQMLLLPQNYKEAPTLARLLKLLGIDYFTLKPYSHHPLSAHSKEDVVNNGFRYSDVLDIEKEIRAMAGNMEVDFRRTAIDEIETKRSYNRCYSTPTAWAYICADGAVYACSAYLGDERFLLGNINQQTFKEIWFSEERKKLLEWMQDYDAEKNCRRVCRMNRTNITLFALRQGTRIKRGPKPGRVNFI